MDRRRSPARRTNLKRLDVQQKMISARIKKLEHDVYAELYAVRKELLEEIQNLKMRAFSIERNLRSLHGKVDTSYAAFVTDLNELDTRVTVLEGAAA